MAEDKSAELTAAQADNLPGLLGLEWTQAVHGRVLGRMTVAKRHMAPNGFLHAASVIALADSACGYGCMVSLPDGPAASRPSS
jgi:1,4-dihydroxy-2-naphthoyl-CoA hydrolase